MINSQTIHYLNILIDEKRIENHLYYYYRADCYFHIKDYESSITDCLLVYIYFLYIMYSVLN